ncbi:hypothetical protein [Nocardia xishanensis]
MFDGGQYWSYWARRALHLASKAWGGAGYALVPHHDGRVDPAVLRACRTYDPDYVVAYPRNLIDFEYFMPGRLAVAGADGQPLSGRARADALAQDILLGDTVVAADRKARDQVAAVCSPYRLVTAATAREVISQIGTPTEAFPDIHAMPGLHVNNCAQCPPNWGGLLGVAVASHAGLVDPPNPAALEPAVSDPTLGRLTDWLLKPSALPPDVLVRLPVYGAALSDVGRAWDYTRTGLVDVSVSHDLTRSILAVVGDSPDDFALARLWQLTYGQGYWLPSPLGPLRQPLPSPLVDGLKRIVDNCRNNQSTLTVTSASLSSADLDVVLHRLLQAVREWPGGDSNPEEISRALPAANLSWPRRNTTHLGVVEQFDEVLSIPAESDAAGTRTMLTPLPPPLVNDQQLAMHGEISWHVDITWTNSCSVLGRGLTGRDLMPVTDGLPVTVARSSRHGTSYPSKRYDLVLGGIPSVNRLPRPMLRDLSLASWVKAKLTQHGLKSRLSPAGQKTAQLTRMLGSRAAVIELLSGPLLPALRKMDAKGKDTKDSYPNGEGVRIRANYGVLNFPGFVTLSTNAADTETREHLDKALRAGVIRRGLVLRCAVCTEVQFQPIDRLGQRWTCERCDSRNDFDLAAWKQPLAEPLWFYDLHPVAMQLLNDHGDVPAALAAYLSTAGGVPVRYQDLAEIELIDDGKSRVELDLIAYRDDTLVIAEAKSAAQLTGKSRNERRDEVRKKCLAAVWLEADELIFGTSEAVWSPRTKDDIRNTVAAFEWPPLGPPQIRLVSGLHDPTTATSTTLST